MRPRFRIEFGLTSAGSGRVRAEPTRPDSIFVVAAVEHFHLAGATLRDINQIPNKLRHNLEKFFAIELFFFNNCSPKTILYIYTILSEHFARKQKHI